MSRRKSFMKCSNCGEELKEGAKFCAHCGTPVTLATNVSKVEETTATNNVDEKNQAAPQAAPTSTQKAPFPKKWIAGIVAIAVVVVAALIMVFTATPTINLDKYTTVSYEGYDSYGKAYVTVDWDKLESDYAGKLKYTDSALQEASSLGITESSLTSVDPVTLLRYYISCDVDTSTNLSNDDKVMLVWSVEESLEEAIKCKLKYSENKECTVEGLEELTTVDIFKDVTVTFEGLSGEGYATIECTDDSLRSYLSIDQTYDLSNGDKVTVSMSDSSVESYAKQYGELPKESSKIYEVEGLSKYVTAMSEVSDDLKSDTRAQADDVMKAYAADCKTYEDITNVTYEYVGDYLEVAKSGQSTWNNNYYGLVYKVTATSDEGSTSIYRVVRYENILVNDDGKCSVTLSNYDTPYSDYERVKGTWKSLYGYSTLDSLTNSLDQDAASFTYEKNY